MVLAQLAVMMAAAAKMMYLKMFFIVGFCKTIRKYIKYIGYD
jgi:hypothetical protein